VTQHHQLAEAERRYNNLIAAGACADSSTGSGDDSGLRPRVHALETENRGLRTEMTDLRHLVEKMQHQIDTLTHGGSGAKTQHAAAAPKKAEKEENDDEVDLFGSDDDQDDEEKEKIKQDRLNAYAAKKSTKPGLIAKSSVLLDVKPWDDETNMQEIEKNVRTIVMDGLVWGASKLVPLAYGIKKLQIMCVVEDEKVSIDELTEKIEGFEDLVQSVDIAAFNKI